MRIAFFTDTFLPQINGIATSIVGFSRSLAARGHKILIVTPAQRGKSEAGLGPDVSVVRLRSIPSFVYPNFRMPVGSISRAQRALDAFRPDVIHVHTPLNAGLYGLRLASTFRVPLVGTNHTYLTPDNDEFLRSLRLPRSLQRACLRPALYYHQWFYGSCDLQLYPSRMLLEKFRPMMPGCNMSCLPNGIDMDRVRILSKGPRDAMRKKHGLRGRVLLNFGRLSHEKNIEAVLRGFAVLRKKREDVMLLLVGDGPARASLQRLARTLNVEGDVVFTGAVPHDRLLASGLLSAADLFVTASAMESQGMVILEAMASGLPTVCLRRAAVGEVVGRSGVLVQSDDPERLAAAMERVLNDGRLAKDLSARSLLRAREFSQPILAERLEGLYGKLLRA